MIVPPVCRRKGGVGIIIKDKMAQKSQQEKWHGTI
jgi:hypothetical protein